MSNYFALEMTAFIVAENRERVVEGRGFFSTRINLFAMPEQHVTCVSV